MAGNPARWPSGRKRAPCRGTARRQGSPRGRAVGLARHEDHGFEVVDVRGLDLLPEQLEQRLEAMQRRLLGERLMEIAQNLIFEMHRPEPSAPWVARQTRKVNGGLAALERHYSTRVQNDLNGFDLGDIAVGTSLLLFEFAVSAGLTMPIDVLVWRGRYPAITKFLEVLEQRPSFVATRPETMVVDIGSTIS